jgi:CHAD domain-containing protein
MFASFARQRRQELDCVIKVLDGERYRRLVEDWEAFLEAAVAGPESAPLPPGTAPAPDAALPVGDLAPRLIAKRHRRLLRKGRKITADSPDRDLHRLRIEGKKLRYLLEFFAPLFPRRQVTGLVKPLKKLQDHLGAFNDLVIQQASLESWLERPAGDRAEASSQEAAAVGGLVSLLGERRRKVRNDFERTFAGFDTAETRGSFARLRPKPAKESVAMDGGLPT